MIPILFCTLAFAMENEPVRNLDSSEAPRGTTTIQCSDPASQIRRDASRYAMLHLSQKQLSFSSLGPGSMLLSYVFPILSTSMTRFADLDARNPNLFSDTQIQHTFSRDGVAPSLSHHLTGPTPREPYASLSQRMHPSQLSESHNS